MKTKCFFLAMLLSLSAISFGQINFGLTAGLNLSNEASSFSNSSLAKLDKQGSYTGWLVGPTVEAMIPVIGWGAELSALYSRKGANFKYNLADATTGSSLNLEGTKKVDCIDFPLNIKYKIGLPKIAKVYFVAGWYWSYAFNGKVAVEAATDAAGQKITSLEKEQDMDFKSSYDNLDQGLDFGAGAEILEKVQLGVYYNLSLKNTSSNSSVKDLVNGSYDASGFDLSSKSRVLSFRLTYLF